LWKAGGGIFRIGRWREFFWALRFFYADSGLPELLFEYSKAKKGLGVFQTTILRM
jgi:hypothetical protein